MKQVRFMLSAALLLGLILTGVAYAGPPEAPAGPDIISTFTIIPSAAYVGDTVTFSVDFTVATADVGARNTLCLYFVNSSYSTPLGNVGNLTSALGDTYAQEGPSGLGGSTANCPAVSGQYVVGWSVANSNIDAEFGDSVSFAFTVPSGASTETFRLRQRNDTSQVSGSNKTLTINTIGSTVYVGNTGCGGNSPCLTGAGALNQAIDNVTDGGTVYIYGTYSMDATASADLTTAKSVTVTGLNNPVLENGGGTCSGAMLVNNGGNTLTVQNITLDGTCSAGSRSAGVWSTTGGTTTVVKNTALHDFTGSGNTAVEVSNGTLVVEGNTFANNQTAMEGTGGTLYAFANNVTTNNGTNAATGVTDGVDNVKCNYWGSASIDNSAQFAERLGSPVSSYVEGPGALSLGQASLAAATSGNQVLINLGRSTSNPPFNNGTTSGLGALASDFFAACLSRDGSGVGAISVTADSVTPGTAGFRLYEITDVLDCSPSTNTACWDYDGASGTTPGATLTDPSPSEGHFVIGNQMDPTVITLRSLTAESDNGPIWALLIGVMFATIALLVGRAVLYRRQR